MDTTATKPQLVNTGVSPVAAIICDTGDTLDEAMDELLDEAKPHMTTHQLANALCSLTTALWLCGADDELAAIEDAKEQLVARLMAWPKFEYNHERADSRVDDN